MEGIPVIMSLGTIIYSSQRQGTPNQMPFQKATNPVSDANPKAKTKSDQRGCTTGLQAQRLVPQTRHQRKAAEHISPRGMKEPIPGGSETA